MNFLVVGDIVGQVGMEMLKKHLSSLKKQYEIDFTIVNGENAADGMGITYKIFQEMITLGTDVVTMGNHTWGKKDIFSFIEEEERIIRPANYAEDLVGKGSVILPCKGKKIGVLNLIGRVEMGTYENPFTVADREIEHLKENGADVIVVDFHAEATAEKKALAYYLKEKVQIFFGTHTHVQTADEAIFETGMGYITDIGMTGPKNSIIGMAPEVALKRFLTQIPERYTCGEGEGLLNAAVFTLEDSTHKVSKIERIQR